MMYLVREAEETVAFDLFFVSCVVFGSFVILNLMIAVQASYLDKAFAEEDAREQEAKQKAERKKKMREQELAEDGIDEDEDEQYADGDGYDQEAADEDDPNGKQKKSNQDQGCCNIKTPAFLKKISDWLYQVVSNVIFERTVIGLILLNTGFLASEFYG